MKSRNVDFIKNDERICIGDNIRRIRIARGIGQTELVAKLQIMNINITRETLVKIESSKQHVKASQLKAIKEVLNTSYEELLKDRTMINEQ